MSCNSSRKIQRRAFYKKSLWVSKWSKKALWKNKINGRLWDQFWCLWVFSHTTELFSHRTRVFYNSVQSLLYLPWVLSPTRLSPLQILMESSSWGGKKKFRLLPGLLTNELYKSEVHIIIFLGSMNLPGRLIEVQKLAYSLDYQFITKDIKRSESTARCRLI